MVYISYYSYDPNYSDDDEDDYQKPFWVIFDDIEEFNSWWKDNRNKCVIVDIGFWNIEDK